MPLSEPPLPVRFSLQTYERSFEIPYPRRRVWAWLCAPESFTRGQIPPYRVEFVDTPVPDGKGGMRLARGFEVGVYNAHHGPLLMAAGVITRVDLPDPAAEVWTRDLTYSYGSKVIAFRWIRPVLLRISIASSGPQSSQIRVRFDAQASPTGRVLLRVIHAMFWPLFAMTVRGGVRRHRQPVG